MPEIQTLEIEATEEGTIVEVLGVVDLKDPFGPKTIIREWLDEKHFRDVEAVEITGEGIAADPPV